MDPLTQTLLQRAQAMPQQIPPAPPQATPVVPPNPTSHVPQEAKRFANAQSIMDAYRGNWTPNPVLLQASFVGK